MKKTFVLAFVLAAVAGLVFAGSAFAQDDTPPFGDGAPRDGSGVLHDYMSTAMADALGISVEELQAAHDEGKTLLDLAEAAGVEDVRTLMQDARDAALESAVADGVITQEQVDAMQARGGRRGGKGGFGNGLCDGSGLEDGARGMRQGGRGGFGQGQGQGAAN